jgi:addiction module RelB/DinJ family antitoxin
MTEQVHYRIDRALVQKAKKVCRDMGLTPTQAVSVFFAQMVKVGGFPFRPTTGSEASGLIDKERRNRVLRNLDDSEVLGSPERRSRLWDAMNEGKPPAR